MYVKKPYTIEVGRKMVEIICMHRRLGVTQNFCTFACFMNFESFEDFSAQGLQVVFKEYKNTVLMSYWFQILVDPMLRKLAKSFQCNFWKIISSGKYLVTKFIFFKWRFLPVSNCFLICATYS